MPWPPRSFRHSSAKDRRRWRPETVLESETSPWARLAPAARPELEARPVAQRPQLSGAMRPQFAPQRQVALEASARSEESVPCPRARSADLLSREPFVLKPHSDWRDQAHSPVVHREEHRASPSMLRLSLSSCCLPP